MGCVWFMGWEIHSIHFISITLIINKYSPSLLISFSYFQFNIFYISLKVIQQLAFSFFFQCSLGSLSQQQLKPTTCCCLASSEIDIIYRIAEKWFRVNIFRVEFGRSVGFTFAIFTPRLKAPRRHKLSCPPTADNFSRSFAWLS